ncbi:PAS domain S-box protein [Limnoglobus roseus]|uniref:histidine kinase n=1 Tax=Limnoglobus roseus TaxID=2598579 RepID=A0A5C1AKD6_9BACT|nr:PAS domain S-box protein [Limnoglobus roseus]QEL17624.1 sensory box histidine kinase/response regulator [Limnoglobus roseus]
MPNTRTVVPATSCPEPTTHAVARFRALLARSLDPVLLFGPDGAILHATPAGAEIMGYRPDELEGTSGPGLIHPDDQDRIGAEMVAVLATPDATAAVEYRARHRDGTWRWLEARAVNLLHEPDVGSLVVSFRDVTRRREAEEELRASERRFRALVENSADAVEVLAADGTILYATPSVVRTGGRTADEVVGRNAFAWGHPDDAAGLAAAHARFLAEPGAVTSGEYRYQHKDGSWRWVAATCTNRLGDPAVGGVVVNLRDVTERVRTEAVLRGAMEASLDAVFILACERGGGRVEDFRFADVNANGAALLDTDRAAVLGRRLCDVHPVNRTGGFLERYVRVVETGTPLEEEFPVRTPGGRDVWLRHQVVRAGDGVVITTRDVTVRRAAEAAARGQAELLRTVIANIPCGVFWKDRDSVYLGCNDLFARNHALPSPDAVVGRTDDELGTPAAQAAGFRAWDRRVMDAGEPALGVEEVLTRPDGSRAVLLTGKVPLRDASGAIVGVLGVYQDITDRKQAEDELRRRDDRLSAQQAALLSLGRDVLRSGTPEAALGRATEEVARTLGVGRVSVWRYAPDRRAIRCADLYEAAADRHAAGAELTAEAYPAYFHALDGGDVVPADNAVADPRTREFAADYLTPLGIGSLLDVTLRPFGQPEGVLCCEHVGPPRRWEADEQVFVTAVGNLLSLAQERWQRQRAEGTARAWNERYEAAVKATGQMLYEWDAATDRVTWAGSCEATLGYAEADMPPDVGGWRAWVHPEDRAAFDREAGRSLASGDPFRLEYRVRRRDGAFIVVDDQGHFLSPGGGRPDRQVGFVVDVTARKRLEEQFRQAQKMEAVGQLAGGVAHDFNNLLTVINGYAALILEEVAAGDPVRDLIGEIKQAGDRAADLTRQLLAFSRQQLLRPRPLALNDEVAGVAQMLRRVIGEDVALVLRPGPALPSVRADRGQVGQVLMNLAVNARDAMPTGGTLTIGTSAVTLEAATTRDGEAVRPGPYVQLSVADTGTGMTDEVRRHAFEPFFTTKEQGKGTGLGLATVYGIVKQSGGHVEVESAVGAGTTVRVYLPAAVAEAGAEGESDEGAPPGGETILLVEDEAGVRGLVDRVLRQRGYTVLAAADAAEAMEVATRRGRPVDLLLTDVVMPGPSGRVLAEELQAGWPELRVLFMSGYTADAVVRHGVASDRADFIQKPFTPDAVARKVREVLDAAGTRTTLDTGDRRPASREAGGPLFRDGRSRSSDEGTQAV